MAAITNGAQLFPQLLNTPPSLENLPNEVLHEILDHIRPLSKTLPKCFTPPYILSQVCRRLRAFALPLLVREVAVHDCTAYCRVLQYFGEGPGNARARFVRSVQIGRFDNILDYDVDFDSIADYDIDFGNKHNNDPYPLPNLRTFSCLGGICNRRQLKPLEKCKHLSSLTLLWSESKFPDFSAWPELHTLRLFLAECQRDIRLARNWNLVASSLTTLSVRETDHASLLAVHVRDMRVPNLRVLSLQEIRASRLVAAVYGFVQRHPSLREVNISFWHCIRLSFDSLVKLIDGSGTWKEMGFNANGSTATAVDDPLFRLDTANEHKETYITFDSFGFVRVPLLDHSLPPHGQKGVRRYKATALALPILNQKCWEQQGLHTTLVPDVFKMADRFPAMEELRITSGTTHWEGTFSTFMEEIGEGLRDWKCLRKLSLSWVIPYRWMWGPEIVPVPGSDVPILDDVLPPVIVPHDDLTTDYLCGPSCGTFLRVADLPRILGLNDARDVIDNLRLSLGPDVDVDAHAEDRNFLIQQWEARHYPLVARMMRHLGERCPTLEEVEWVPTGTWHPSHSVRWVWKFHRGKTLRVTDDFTYGSGLCGCIPYLPNLVGQELVSMRDLHASRSGPYPLSRIR